LSPSDPPVQILVVEDDPGMLVLAEDRLAEVEGWEVTGASAAAQCRALIATRRFDVILLDRGLPDGDGATLIGELIGAFPDVAIVMLTGADSAESATETLKLGAWDYVVKRPDLKHLDDLPAIVRRCVERIRWRRDETRLRHEMDLLLTAIRSTGDAVIMTDCERRVHFWNAAAEKLFGWRAEEVLGELLPVVPPDCEAEAAELSERARQGDPLVGIETVRRRRDGSLVEVSLTLTAAAHADGSVRAYVAVVRDISERKALERARADFVAILAHDIRTPLSVITGYTQIALDSDGVPDEVREFLLGTERSTRTLLSLVANYLQCSRIEAGQLILAKRPLAVNELLERVCQPVLTECAGRGVTLNTQLRAGLPLVDGDPVALEQVFANLLQNAFKFTPEAGCITIQSEHAGRYVVVSVIDTGPGVPTEELPKLFGRYRQAVGGHQRSGTGLGLFIVKTLVEAHGGGVCASSTLGVGSRFTVRLPAADSVRLIAGALITDR